MHIASLILFSILIFLLSQYHPTIHTVVLELYRASVRNKKIKWNFSWKRLQRITVLLYILLLLKDKHGFITKCVSSPLLGTHSLFAISATKICILYKNNTWWPSRINLVSFEHTPTPSLLDRALLEVYSTGSLWDLIICILGFVNDNNLSNTSEKYETIQDILKKTQDDAQF